MLLSALLLASPLLSPPLAVAAPPADPTTATRGAPAGPGTLRRQVSQFGITWRFTKDELAGRFANGDWWVVGPIELERITPASLDQGGRVINGSMVNPGATDLAQGYDSAMYGRFATAATYDPKLNVALGVSTASPLQLEPGSSLISSISVPTAGARPQLDTAAILTVLDQAPNWGSFRPPYAGTDKTVRFRKNDLKWMFLRNVPAVSSTPAMAEVERMFERPWIDHVPGWAGRYIHPAENMPDYGREMADQVGIASLMLQLDFTHAEKEKLLISLVQFGIDTYAVLRAGNGKNWQAGGGHHSGRKWPILFAGAMLFDIPMVSIGLDPSLLFMGEDGQTFYVAETSPGVFNNGYGGYGPQHKGMPEWGQKHALDRSLDDLDWYGDPYRVCCTANSWTGQLLAVRMMGGKALWNHNALFDYQDRFVEMQKANGGSIATHRFSLDMWNQYRDQY